MNIFGQNTNATQLNKANSEWQNGYGTQSDGMDTNSNNEPAYRITRSAKSIVIYFSRSGSTELVATKIAQETKSDILEIVNKKPYAANYRQTLNRANYERDNMIYPELNMEVPDLKQYKMIYLGFPIWAMTLSHPMTSFLQTYGSELSNKIIAPFMTEGGYGHGDSVQKIAKILKQQGTSDDRITPPLIIDGNKADKCDKTLNQWVKTVTINKFMS